MKYQTINELTTKYIAKTKLVFKNLITIEDSNTFDVKRTAEVIAEAKRYLKDAEYYLEKNKSETSLVSIAYCEGLLDALKILGYVKF